MSDDLERVPHAGTESGSASDDAPDPTRTARALPNVSSPAAIQSYNQFNVQQIPPSAVDKLSAGDVVQVIETSLSKLDSHDERKFEFAMDKAKKREDADKRRIYVGGSLAALGLGAIILLAWLGQREVAMMLVVFLATVIGATIGGRSGR